MKQADTAVAAALIATARQRATRRRAIKVVTTTQDLAAIVAEIGGDKVTVESLAKGYQDPHFVEAKPSFIIKLHSADLLVVVGRELEIGWLPPLITQSRNATIQPGGAGYLDASQTVQILDMPTGQITRAMGDVHPAGQPALLARSRQRPADRAGRAGQADGDEPRRRRLLRAALRRLRPPPRGEQRSAGRRRWRPTRGSRSSPITGRGRTSPTRSASTSSATSSRSRASRRRRPHARAAAGDEAAEREDPPGRARTSI